MEDGSDIHVGWATRQAGPAVSETRTGTGSPPANTSHDRSPRMTTGDPKEIGGVGSPMGRETAQNPQYELLGERVKGGDDPRLTWGYYPLTAPSGTADPQHPTSPEFQRGGGPIHGATIPWQQGATIPCWELGFSPTGLAADRPLIQGGGRAVEGASIPHDPGMQILGAPKLN